jgi:protein-disulfide isomerase
MARAADIPQLTPPVGERDHIWGPVNAPVTMVEYGDYECPYCGAAHPIVKELQRMVGDRMRYVYRHFPLAAVHPHAEHAAEAAECAGAEGKFWEMHDALFEHQDALEDEDLAAYAAMIGLSEIRFARDLTQHKYAPKVREDFLSGARSGVNGTPTFFINGFRHNGKYDLNTLLAVVENAAELVTARRPVPAKRASMPD